LKNETEEPALEYIHENIALQRIEHVEKLTRSYAVGDLLDIEKYFNSTLTESCYRAHKGSYKTAFSKARGSTFLGLILYVLFGEPKFNSKLIFDSNIERKIRRVLKKRFEKDSYFRKYGLKYLATKTGDRDKKSGWINVDPYVFSLLGGELFYYCTLRALIEICRKALTDKNYKFPVLISWREGIVLYLVEEVVGKEKMIEYLKKQYSGTTRNSEQKRITNKS